MNVAIIDDDIKFSKMLKKDVISIFSQFNEFIHVDIYISMNESILSMNYDIVFLDIILDHEQMDEVSFEEGIKINRYSPETTLVFISNYDHFVYDSYQCNTFFFIRKSQLIQDLNNFFRKYKEQKSVSYIDIPYNKQTLHLPQNRILYVSSQLNKVILTLNNEEIEIYDTLKHIYSLLDQTFLYKLNGHVIINLMYVDKIEQQYIVMKNGENIYFTRGSKTPFLKAYVEYKGRMLCI